MDRNFKRALPLVLKHEGGFVDHPKDPGGATNKGVTIATFRRYVKANATVADLKRISDEQVATVYYRHYWSAVNAAALPAGLDYAVFDFAVNSGPSRAAKFLQALVGAKQDGRIGPATIEAVAAFETRFLINALCDKRTAFLKRLPTWKTFGKGWTSRVSGVRKTAIGMVGRPADVKVETIEKEIEVEKPVVPKTVDKEVKEKTNWLTGIFGTGGLIGGTVAWLKDADAQTLLIVGGFAAAGIAVTLVGGRWIIQRIKVIRAEIAT